MGWYSYKSIRNHPEYERALAAWEAEAGRKCDGDPGYDGDMWLVAAKLVDMLTTERDAARAEVERLRQIAHAHLSCARAADEVALAESFLADALGEAKP